VQALQLHRDLERLDCELDTIEKVKAPFSRNQRQEFDEN